MSSPTPASHAEDAGKPTPEAKREEQTAAAPTVTENAAQGGATEAAGAEEKNIEKKVKTRLLKDVEAEENRIIYEALYQSLDTEEERQVHEELTTGDTLRLSKEAKAQFLKAVTDPMSEKAKACGLLMKQMSSKENQRVATIFMAFSAAMFTLPVIALFVGMNLVAPRLGYDDVLCGGFLALGTTILIMATYAIYAMCFEKSSAEREAAAEQTTKKKKD